MEIIETYMVVLLNPIPSDVGVTLLMLYVSYFSFYICVKHKNEIPNTTIKVDITMIVVLIWVVTNRLYFEANVAIFYLSIIFASMIMMYFEYKFMRAIHILHHIRIMHFLIFCVIGVEMWIAILLVIFIAIFSKVFILIKEPA